AVRGRTAFRRGAAARGRLDPDSGALMAVQAVDQVVPRDPVVWGFGPEMEPVLEVEPGSVVRLETNDCFTGQIRTEADLVTDIDFGRVNSATGPVAVKGAEPGDSLIVELLEV